jgi:TonB family protein
MVAVGVFFLAGQPEENVEPQTVTEPVTAAPAATEADVVFGPPAVEQLINVAEAALLDSRLRDADDALRRVTTLDPANARLPFLTAQLAQAQLRQGLNEARTAIREGRFEDAFDALSAAQTLAAVSGSTEVETLTAELKSARSEQQTDEVLALANASLLSGALLSPPNDNARYYYELVLSNDPENAAAQQGLSTIANRVVLQARTEIDNGNFDVAQELLYDARALDSKNSELVTTANALQAARKSAKAALAARESAKAALAARESAKAALAATAAATAAMQASDTERPADDAAPAGIVAEAAEPVAPPVADEKPTLDVVPAAVNSLVRLNYVAPKYPRNALRRNLSGWVDIEFTVSTEGTVKDIGARASEPGDVFVGSATRAIEQWRFEPVLRDGVVVEKRAAVRMMFSLD